MSGYNWRNKTNRVKYLVREAQLTRYAARLAQAMPAVWYEHFAVVRMWRGSLLFTLGDEVTLEWYKEFRHFLRVKGYTLVSAKVDSARRSQTLTLQNKDTGHTVEITRAVEAKTPECVQLIVGVDLVPEREWVCPDDPQYQAKVATHALYESMLKGEK